MSHCRKIAYAIPIKFINVCVGMYASFYVNFEYKKI